MGVTKKPRALLSNLGGALGRALLHGRWSALLCIQGSIAGSEAEQNLQTLHEAVAAAQAAEAAAAAVQGVFHDHPAFQASS